MEIDLTQLSEGEIAWLKDKGIVASAVRLKKAASKSTGKEKLLQLTKKCNFCSYKETVWFHVLSNKNSHIISPEVAKENKILEKHYQLDTLFLCSHCKAFLEKKSKEELIDIILLKRRGLINEGSIYIKN